MNCEGLDALNELFKNNNAYIMSSIEGKGCHIGRIVKVNLDANDDLVIETDIDSISCTQ